MAVLDATSTILTLDLEQRSIKDIFSHKLGVYTAVIDGVLCRRHFTPDIKPFTISQTISAYKIYTDTDKDGVIIYDYITDGEVWDFPETGVHAFRVKIEEGVPKLYTEEITFVERIEVNKEFTKANRMVKVNNAPIGMVIHGFLTMPRYKDFR